MRAFRLGDADALCLIDYRADQQFANHGYPQIAAEPLCGRDEFMRAFADSQLTVAVCAVTTLPVGYVATETYAGHAYIRQMSVDPDHGRKGIGSSLLRHAVEQARNNRFLAIWLSTFRNVPFNMPFYAKQGFEEVALENANSVLIELFNKEVPADVDPSNRVLMRLSLR